MIPSFNNEAVRSYESIGIYILLRYMIAQMPQRFSVVYHEEQIYIYDALNTIYCDITHWTIIEQLSVINDILMI